MVRNLPDRGRDVLGRGAYRTASGWCTDPNVNCIAGDRRARGPWRRASYGRRSWSAARTFPTKSAISNWTRRRQMARKPMLRSARAGSRRTVSCRMVLCRMVLGRTVPCRMVLCRTVPRRMVLCRTVLCRMVRCRMVLCRTLRQIWTRVWRTWPAVTCLCPTRVRWPRAARRKTTTAWMGLRLTRIWTRHLKTC